MPYRPTARAEVVAGLLLRGGAVESSSGLAVAALAEAIFEATGRQRQPRNLSSLLSVMEKDRQISRRLAGRRTFRIALEADELEPVYGAAVSSMGAGAPSATRALVRQHDQQLRASERRAAEAEHARAEAEYRVRGLEKRVKELEGILAQVGRKLEGALATSKRVEVSEQHPRQGS